ncbi:MAG: hypothetical protein JXB15_03820 [Anaerolineales bacterium]|nr:hypothetical protein [Anaerolineales bacterium]
MKRNVRILLMILGLLVACCSLLALGYALWPLAAGELQATLAPTLFAPPP